MENAEEKEAKNLEVIADMLQAISNSLFSWKDYTKEKKAVMERNYEHLGKIIACHLLVENLLNTVLINDYHGDEEKLTSGKVSFSEKVKKLSKTDSFYRALLPGIDELNDIRNSIAHNLDYDLSEAVTENMEKVLPILKIANTVTVREKVEGFTLFCIMATGIKSKGVVKEWNDLKSKHPDVFDIDSMAPILFKSALLKPVK